MHNNSIAALKVVNYGNAKKQLKYLSNTKLPVTMHILKILYPKDNLVSLFIYIKTN